MMSENQPIQELQKEQKEEYQREREKQQRTFHTAILIAMAALTVICVTACLYWAHKEKARMALKEAKTVELAVRMVSLDYYAQNQKFRDTAQKSGISEAAEAEIRKVSEAEGDIYLETWDSSEHRATHLVYDTGQFLVDYRYYGGEQSWNVYELNHIIIH